MKRLVGSLVLLGCISTVAFAGGFSVGNGGDAVRCVETHENNYNGIYSLDYLMTLNGAGYDTAHVIKSWEDSQARIKKLLSDKYPELLPSFENFLKDLGNNNDWTKKRIWLAAGHGLIDVKDEQIIRTLPENCIKADFDSEKGNVILIQAVVRNKQSEIIRYEFDAKVLMELKKDPIQYSYLMVHEWLWDHIADPQVIRWANQFIHSVQADNLSPEIFKKSLNNIGLFSGYNGFWSVCDRSLTVRRMIEDTVKKNCSHIEVEDLQKVEMLDLRAIATEDLDVNDLNGLSMLKTFKIFASATLKRLPKEYFWPATNLETVGFGNIPMSEIDSEWFSKNVSLQTLSFMRMPVQTLNRNFWDLMPSSLEHFSLTESQLSSLPDDFFVFHGSGHPNDITLNSNPGLNKVQVRELAKQSGFKNLIMN